MESNYLDKSKVYLSFTYLRVGWVCLGVGVWGCPVCTYMHAHAYQITENRMNFELFETFFKTYDLWIYGWLG